MTVYAVHQHMRRSKRSGQLEPAFDLSPARVFGEIKFLLGPSVSPFEPEPVIRQLEVALQNFSDDDFLLLVGNPILIGLATAVAADVNGRVNFLQWSGINQCYRRVQAQVFADCAQEGAEAG